MNSVENLLRRLEQLNAVGAALSKERDINRLLESILVAAKTITHADGGTLYRVSDDARALRFEILRTDSLDIAMGGTSGKPSPLSELAAAIHRGRCTQRLLGGRVLGHPRQTVEHRRRVHRARLRFFRDPQV